MRVPPAPPPRQRRDRCPGALRPWPAEDGLLVRLRLVGGEVTSAALRALSDVAAEHADGRIHLTSRANLQVRGFRSRDGALAPEALAAIEATGLLPSRTHELVRNLLVSPQTGLAGGRADLRPLARALDAALVAEPRLASLPGRFLFVLDDGRGDLVQRACDLGAVAVDATSVQLRVGDGHGAVVDLDDACRELVGLARCFLDLRGEGPSAAWHVRELDVPLVAPRPGDPRLPGPSGPLQYGAVPGGRHVEAPGGVLTADLVEDLCAAADRLIITPWRGVLVPEETR